MPLSDHEQRLLEQMEQQLLSDDPRFASTMRGPRTMPAARRRLIFGIAGVAIGLALLVVSVVVFQKFWLGAVFFVIMVGGLVYALSGTGTAKPAPAGPGARVGPAGIVSPDGTVRRPAPGRATRPSSGRAGSSGRARRRGTFMQRLEARWDRRRDERWG